jgi:hypothetical protein
MSSDPQSKDFTERATGKKANLMRRMRRRRWRIG